MRSKLHTILFLSAFCFVSAVSLDVMAQDFLEPDNRFMGKDNHDEYAYELKQYLFPEVHFGGYSYYNPDKSLSVSFIGYENSIIIGEFHDVFNLFNGLNLLIELQKQSFRFALNGSALWGRLLSSDFYYDSDNNYNWNTD